MRCTRLRLSAASSPGRWLAVIIALTAGGCDNRPHWGAPPAQAPYDFYAPTQGFQLHYSLSEISGITILDSTRLAAVEDEHGIIYILNRQTGDILAQVPFAGLGDYEGVELVDERLFTLRSNGIVDEIVGWRSGQAQARPFGALPVQCDAEGLGFDHLENRLLVACKFKPTAVGRLTRPVYALDLTDSVSTPLPAFEADVRAVYRHPNYDSKLDRLLRTVTESFRDLSGFRPSAIAVHPASGLIHILSSDHKAIAVFDRQGTLRNVWKLPGRVFRQPEGMIFAPDGTLYISNEGPNGTATLLVFKPLPVPAG